MDFNTIVTEPAPLEALAQRFGRVNRRGTSESPPAEVYVLTAAIDDKVNEMIYNPELLERALKLVKRENGNEIDEAKLSGWLDEIYGEDLKASFSKEVRAAEAEFHKTCLDTLRAFDANEALEDQFDKLFDGVEVLPVSKVEEYKQKMLEDSALAASGLLVPISHRQYWHHRDKISGQEIIVSEGEGEGQERKTRAKVLVANLEYNSDSGLQFDQKGEAL